MTEKPQAETFVERVKAIVRKAATKNGESMECNAKGHARTYLYYVDADTFCNAMDEMAATYGQKLRDFLGGPLTNVQVTKVCTFLGHVIRMHIINDEDLQMRDILFAFADYYPKTTTVRSKLSETSITDEQKVFLGIFKGLLKRKKA